MSVHLRRQLPPHLFRLAFLGKDFHLKVAASLAGWGVVSLVLGRAKQHNLFEDSTTEVNVGEQCRVLQ